MKGNWKKTYNTLTMSIVFMLIAVASFVVSCVKDDDIHNGRTVLYPEFVSKSMVSATTKALPNGSSYHNNLPAATRVYAYAVNTDPLAESKGQQEKIEGRFTKKSGTISSGPEWYSNLEIENVEYNIYGLGTYGIGDAPTVTQFTTTTLQAQVAIASIATQYDPTISVATAKNAAADLTEGTYTFDNTTYPEGGNKVYMAMQHLYSQASLKFKADASYNELRTIEITGVTVSSVDKTGLSFSFTAGSLPTVAWTTPLTAGTENSFDLPHEKLTITEGVQTMETITYPVVLNSSVAKDAGSFRFAPLLKTVVNSESGETAQLVPVSITVDYNIYRYELDGESNPYTDDAHFIRSSSATNSKILTFKVNNTKDPTRNRDRGTPQVGNNYDITITVAPSYLYVLADEDAQFKLEIEE